MGKNQTGGKHKHLKRESDGSKPKEIQKSTCADELYCIVEKVLGNGMFHGRCEDNILRLVHIPGKFRGFGKKDNLIVNNVWVLVGLRSYETINPKKLQNCELVYVYTDIEKDILKRSVNKNWSLFISIELKQINGDNSKNTTNTVEFADQAVSEYESIVSKAKKDGEADETVGFNHNAGGFLTLLDVADI